MGLRRRAGLRPRPDARPWRRLSGLRLLRAASARDRVGIFAFANRTYAGPSPPVWQRRARAAPRRAAAPGGCRSAPRSRSCTIMPRDDVASAAISSRRASAPRDELPDGPQRRELGARIRPAKAETGDCRTDAPIAATGALTGAVRLDLRARPPPGPAPARPDRSADHPGAAAARRALKRRAALLYIRDVYTEIDGHGIRPRPSSPAIRSRCDMPAALGIEPDREWTRDRGRQICARSVEPIEQPRQDGID